MIAYLFPGQGSQKVGMYNLLGDKAARVVAGVISL